MRGGKLSRYGKVHEYFEATLMIGTRTFDGGLNENWMGIHDRDGVKG